MKTPFSTGHQRDAESRDSASGVRAACLSDVLLAGSSIQVRSLHPPRVNGGQVSRGPLALNERVFSEPVKSLCPMESRYRATTHRGYSTPSRSFCRYLQMTKTPRQPTETGTVWL